MGVGRDFFPSPLGTLEIAIRGRVPVPVTRVTLDGPVTLAISNKRSCGRLPSAAWPREYGSANGTCKALLVPGGWAQESSKKNHQSGIAEQWLPRT